MGGFTHGDTSLDRWDTGDSIALEATIDVEKVRKTMPIHSLNHFFIRSENLELTKEFYMTVLGFEVMARPDFPFPGYWLGINGSIQVHLGPSNIPNREKYYIGTGSDAANGQTGVIDHVAFLAEEPETFVERFQEKNISFRPRHFPESNLYQLFIRDPNGVMIELNFFNITQAPAWNGEDYSKMERVTENHST
jgi:catechol 2,3-dioxygenase-like lactoylglutathione lyase family enzyme